MKCRWKCEKQNIKAPRKKKKRKYLYDLRVSKYLLNRVQNHQYKKKCYKSDYIKIKNFYMPKIAFRE